MDKQYWAKGTGFGTGSTTSSHTISAARAKHQLEEKYVSICFSILSEFLNVMEDKSVTENGGRASKSPTDTKVENEEEADTSKKEEVETEKKKEKDGSEDNASVPESEKKEVDEDVKEETARLDFCTVEVVELLCRSCLLPTLATCLLNDSGTVLWFI